MRLETALANAGVPSLLRRGIRGPRWKKGCSIYFLVGSANMGYKHGWYTGSLHLAHLNIRYLVCFEPLHLLTLSTENNGWNLKWNPAKWHWDIGCHCLRIQNVTIHQRNVGWGEQHIAGQEITQPFPKRNTSTFITIFPPQGDRWPEGTVFPWANLHLVGPALWFLAMFCDSLAPLVGKKKHGKKNNESHSQCLPTLLPYHYSWPLTS